MSATSAGVSQSSGLWVWLSPVLWEFQLVSNKCRQIWHHSIYAAAELAELRKENYQGCSPGRTFSLDGDSRGYPVFIIVNRRLQVIKMDLPTQTNQLEP